MDKHLMAGSSSLLGQALSLASQKAQDVYKRQPLQHVDVGDIVAVFGTGAYNHTMASNYNGQPRPAIVFVKDGKARVTTRRETYDDLMSRDI